MTKKAAVNERAKQLAALVDELGECQQRIAPVKADMARAETLRKALLSECAEIAPEQCATFLGYRYTASFSPCERTRRVDIGRLFKALGLRKFLTHCTFPIRWIDENLSLTERASVLTEGREGPRKMTISPNSEAKAA